jgi:hypothetical protein
MAHETLAAIVPRGEERADELPAWALGFLRGGGLGLLAYGIAGAILNGSRPASYLDLSPIEDGTHIAFALLMLYVGFIAPTTRLAFRTLTLIGMVSLIVGVVGPTSAEELIPDHLTRNGVVDGAWAVAHDVIHVVAGAANLAIAFALTRPRAAGPS